jgi:hypothetical protein
VDSYFELGAVRAIATIPDGKNKDTPGSDLKLIRSTAVFMTNIAGFIATLDVIPLRRFDTRSFSSGR